jgi:RimJ/RimL family protein N-acetyltransferase
VTAESIRLGCAEDPSKPWLQAAGFGDQDALRTWRNANAGSFFNQEPIGVVGQQQWYEAYRSRPDDFMFMVMEGERSVGCIGIRIRDDEWDVYNVIRGVQSPGSAGFMSQALAAVIEFAQTNRVAAVRADVVTGNPALTWYLRNGFVITAGDERSLRLRYQ